MLTFRTRAQICVAVVLSQLIVLPWCNADEESAKPDVMPATQTYLGQRLNMDVELVTALAKLAWPNRKGAIGRNKRAYIHVRFQRGLHHLAEHGLVLKNCRSISAFFSAADYALSQQNQTGEFRLAVPTRMQVSDAERASGVAFFMASLGPALLSLEADPWFARQAECKNTLSDLNEFKAKLQVSYRYLVSNQELLLKADHNAPNRLLFNGLALYSLAQFLGEQDVLTPSKRFVQRALQQIDEEQGFFIESGGFDSSYNGVACALVLRLIMLGYSDNSIKYKAYRAIRWQTKRVRFSGEIRADGNTRVNPRASGESFMGRKKDVDVGHTLEALVLATLVFEEDSFTRLAKRVLNYYQ